MDSMDSTDGRADGQPVRFPSLDQPPVMLEGRLALPAEASPRRRCPAVVLCHPQPLVSDLTDPLIALLAEELPAHGVAALRFNFRGAGASQGDPTDGRLEPLDVAGAVQCLLSHPAVDGEKLGLIGHAFGAYVALAYAAHDSRVRMVVAVSPPSARLTPDLGAFDRPRLFVTGERDEVAPPFRLEPWIAGLPGGCALRVVSGAPHLMVGHEHAAAESILRFVERWATTPGV
ncbi:MAG TPA: alpha/beta fold hydrolase [Ktedonobacterales bacterium]|jgi:hypothetical protein